MIQVKKSLLGKLKVPVIKQKQSTGILTLARPEKDDSMREELKEDELFVIPAVQVL